jgi:hypothetical protein
VVRPRAGLVGSAALVTGTELRLHLDAPSRDGAVVRRTATLASDDGASAPLWFEHAALDGDPALLVRPFLLAALVPAMRRGRALRVPAPVDATTIDNLMEWQEAMASWRPDRLRRVAILCDVAPAEPPTGAGAVTAFSGGVDSTFTLVRHTATHGHYRTTRLDAGLMIHGFDIALGRTAEFAGAWERSQAMLGAFGVRPLWMRTNLRDLEATFDCDWGYETHGIWLAAALACFEPAFAVAMIPSSYRYPWLKLPWASNPLTDPLLGSATIPCWHDGGAHSKLDKVRVICAHEVVRRNLRVCWQGDLLDRNCGRCFKCVSTQACFRLATTHSVPAFADPCTLDDVARLHLKDTQNLRLVRSMRDAARAQSDTALADALDRSLAAWVEP